MPSLAQCPPKANEGQRAKISVLYVDVCQRVCVSVLYTEPGQRSCSTFPPQKVSLGKMFPSVSAESRLNAHGYSIRICVPVYDIMSGIAIVHELDET